MSSIVIPNIIHFIWLTGPKSRDFGFINYLAVRAAHSVQNANVIYMHNNVEPVGNQNWEAIKPYVTILPVTPSPEIEYPQYQADLIRLDILLESGGIYLDTDMLMIKPVYFNRTTMGVESYRDGEPNSLNAGIIIAAPGCPFIARWKQEMLQVIGTGDWSSHCVNLACEVYKQNPLLIDLRPAEEFLPFDFNDEWVYGPVSGKVRLENSYSLHLYDTYWEGVEWSELRKVDNNYLKTNRNLFTHLFGRYAMPYSSQDGKNYIQHIMGRVKPSTGVDIGCGSGTYAKLFPNVKWSGVEVWVPYVEQFGLNDLYDDIYLCDARKWKPKDKYDVAIAGDVLEHMTKEEAIKLLKTLRSCADYVIVSIPIGHYPQDEYEGNPHEAHVKDDWSDAEVREAFGEPIYGKVDGEIGIYVYSNKPLPLKICVYAISKNEELFVERFCTASRDADMIVIADTGSTDRTVELAHEHGAAVHDIIITPWRFDDARNAALALLPRDIDVCVSLDLDEELQPGWREEIERVWVEGTTRLRYGFDWGAGIVFKYEKIHARTGYRWTHPCHEYPIPYLINEQYAETDMLMVIHKPDPTKSRGQYLPLLEMSVKEDPVDPRNAFYYARELSFHGHWEKSIQECNRYLALPGADWANERCYAYRVMSRCYNEMGDWEAAVKAARMGVIEAPYTREPWCEIVKLTYQRHKWAECYGAAMSALAIEQREWVYTVDPEVWGAMPHDYASIAAWNLGMREEAVRQVTLALQHNPNDPRLLANLEYYKA